MNVLNVAWFTFLQAFCSTLVSLCIGIPIAFFCARRRFFFKKILLSLSVIPFCVPTLIVALGYVTFLGMNGALNKWLMFIFGLSEPPVKILYSFVGLIIAQGFYDFPIIMKTVSTAWQNIPNDITESAKVLGAGRFRIFRTVTIYHLLPSIASSSLLVFIYTFLSFIFVLLFGGVGNSTLEVEIYKTAKTSLDFSKVGILATIETLILCFVTFLYALLEKKSDLAKGFQSIDSKKNQILPKIGNNGVGEVLIFGTLMSVIVVGFLAPLFGIVWNAFSSSSGESEFLFSFANFSRVIKMRSFSSSLKWTIITATATGFFSTVIGFLYSYWLNSSRLLPKSLPILPMCISNVVVGVLITMIFKRASVWILIFVQTALTWPLAYKVINPHMQKIEKVTLEAAQILSKNRLNLIKKIIIPLIKKSLLTAFSFCFAVSAGDATLPLVLSIPKFDTLSLFTYRLAGSYRFDEACAAGCILCGVCVIVSLVIKIFEVKK